MPFLIAEWRHLVMANWEVDPTVLERFVPAGTVLDSHDGVTYASLVAFRFLDTKVRGVPIPFHRNFEEINLRIYVRRDLPGEVRRGVVFIREIVPKPAIASVARLAYHEPYVALPTRSTIDEQAGRYEYEWQSGPSWSRLAATVNSTFSLPARGSAEAFITEHYWGYNRQPDGTTLEYRVDHPQWRVGRATSHEFRCDDVETLYGEEFLWMVDRPPSSVFVADGSEVSVHPGKALQ